MSGSMRGSIVSGATPRRRAPGISASSGAPKPASALVGAGADTGVRGGGGRVARPLRRTAVTGGTATDAGTAATGAPHFRHSLHEAGTMYPQPGHRFIVSGIGISRPGLEPPNPRTGVTLARHTCQIDAGSGS